MNLKGSRKLVMVAMFGGVIAALPNMTDSQVTLLSTLILAAFGGNGIEYLAEVAKGVAVRGRGAPGPISSVRSVTVPEPKPVEEGAH